MWKLEKGKLQKHTSNIKVSTSSLISKSVKDPSRDAAIKRSNMASRFLLTKKHEYVSVIFISTYCILTKFHRSRLKFKLINNEQFYGRHILHYYMWLYIYDMCLIQIL